MVNVIVSGIETKGRRGLKLINEKSKKADNKESSGECFKFIMILSEHELSTVNNIFLGLDSFRHFHCMYFVARYILKNKINNYDFIRNNCRDMGLVRTTDQKFRSLGSIEPELQSNNTIKSDSLEDNDHEFVNHLPVYELLSESGDTEPRCCSSKSTCSTGSEPKTLSDIYDSFKDEIGFLDEAECKDDYYDFSDKKETKYEDINYDFGCIEKSEILKELMEAVNRNSSDTIEYSGLSDVPVSNEDIKKALSETENNIDLKRKNIRMGNKKLNSETRALMEVETPEAILDNLSVKNVADFAKKLTGAITKSKETRIRNYFTEEYRRQIFNALIEFLYIYSTIEKDFEKIDKNYGKKRAELRSLFNINSNIYLINNVFGKLIGEYDDSVSKKVYSAQDCTRFFMSVITPISKQILPTQKLVRKLKYTCEFTFPSLDDENRKREFFEEYFEEGEESEHFYDTAVARYLINKNFEFKNSSEVIEESVKAIIDNRREIPIDRPNECYKKLGEIFLRDKRYDPSPKNELKLRRTCAKIYGLLGFLSASKEIYI
ncbi:hypothetical protein FG386_000390 [Cryptosporidium ryanae]|uniref:uncharacterized protein n=1 Tax=Cryptosporidium ryanae TaxID=515981 RepID=UPI00351A85A3|nr:hypothetical protein FG386_000390 [Cryptosporidium ryanae]